MIDGEWKVRRVEERPILPVCASCKRPVEATVDVPFDKKVYVPYAEAVSLVPLCRDCLKRALAALDGS